MNIDNIINTMIMSLDRIKDNDYNQQEQIKHIKIIVNYALIAVHLLSVDDSDESPN